MKFRLLVPVLVLAFSAPGMTAQTVLPAEEILNRLATGQVVYLENRHGIPFDRAAFNGVCFGIPAEDNQANNGEYAPAEKRVYVNQSWAPRLLRLEERFGKHAFEGVSPRTLRGMFLELLRHELGHAKADQTSRRIGNGAWPSYGKDTKPSWQAIYGLRILSEGIGGHFGYFGRDNKAAWSEKDLPEKSDRDYWLSSKGSDSIYDGGFWLVNEIFKHRGSASAEEVIEYLVTHPLDFPDGNARKAAKEYRNKALTELGKKGDKK